MLIAFEPQCFPASPSVKTHYKKLAVCPENCIFAKDIFFIMKIKEVAQTLERFAPLPLQDSYDNAGLQIGLTETEASGVLLCLDVTEDVISEAQQLGLNLIVSHHPLLFHGVKCVSNRSYVERCMRMAIKSDIAIYSAHTNLDNARGGVNFALADMLGLNDVTFLQPHGDDAGSGVIGCLPQPLSAADFLVRVATTLHTECLMHNRPINRPISRVALCGGAGDFLLNEAIEAQADAFITGEMHYHHYFGHEDDIQIAVTGHYQSEVHTLQIFRRILQEQFPTLRIVDTRHNTNPIHYTTRSFERK